MKWIFKRKKKLKGQRGVKMSIGKWKGAIKWERKREVMWRQEAAGHVQGAVPAGPKHQRPPAEHMTSSHLTPFALFLTEYFHHFSWIFRFFEAEPDMMLTSEEQPCLGLPSLVVTMSISHTWAPALIFPARLGSAIINF